MQDTNIPNTHQFGRIENGGKFKENFGWRKMICISVFELFSLIVTYMTGAYKKSTSEMHLLTKIIIYYKQSIISTKEGISSII